MLSWLSIAAIFVAWIFVLINTKDEAPDTGIEKNF